MPLPYPVHYEVIRPARFARTQVVTRILAVLLLVALGASLQWIVVAAFVGLPLYASIRLAAREPSAWFAVDAPRLEKALSWFASIYGWFGLVTDRIPTRRPDETVHVEVVPTGTPTAAKALARVVLGIPSAAALAVLAIFGALVWLWSVITVLAVERVGAHAYRYLAGLQRWTVRLLAYQASLVEEYPPFSLHHDTPPELPERPSPSLTVG